MVLGFVDPNKKFFRFPLSFTAYPKIGDYQNSARFHRILPKNNVYLRQNFMTDEEIRQ
jgi:hypothetical protein